MLDTMLNFATSDLWRKLRVKMTPTFSTGKMKRMFPIIEHCSNDMIAQFDQLIAINDEIDVKTVYGNFILDVITKIAFAVDINCDDELKHRLQTNAKIMFDPPLWKILFFLTFRKVIQKFERFVSKEMTFCVKFIESMIKERQRQKDQKDEKKDAGDKKRVDFLQLLLDDEMDAEVTSNEEDSISHLNIESDAFEKKNYKQDKLSKDEIVANCLMFLIVGFHTVTHSMTFVTYLLALNGDKQQALYEEIKQHIDKHGTVKYDTLMKLSYLDAVICETLRLLPPATHLARVTGEDYPIDTIRGLVLEKSTVVQIPIYYLHRNPKYYDNSSAFMPERFLPENRDNIIPYTYLPFGAGPRNCIGMRFALMEVKIAICSLIMKYKIVKCDKTPNELAVHNFDGLLRINDLFVKFERRN